MVAPIMGLVDGPTEVHRTTVGRQILKRYQPVEGLWPSQHLPTRLAAAKKKYAAFAEAFENEVGNW
jgi:acyl-CoA dehydrogenase